ncbi:winged helix-turn-helix domain-containing protein [Hafnia paralvei]|uniref:winged helix-turn-helix domain-containing protein n=1 Tax=Hafnia paralvei TaxID=546367 RepID=UPI0010338E75|nr:winged helix-turn-helix domain-containing protein [Hafnia paralvei]TBL61981.1 hypothetical protein EYY97_10245 [Hafnia paralvei]
MLIVDMKNGTVTCADKKEVILYLSKNECLVLELLYNNSGDIVSSDTISKTCWPGRIVSPVSVPVAIKHVRDVLKKCSPSSLIKTYKGEGYSFVKGEMVINFCHENTLPISSEHTLNSDITPLFFSKKTMGVVFIIALSSVAIMIIFDTGNSITSNYDTVKSVYTVQNYPYEKEVNPDIKNLRNVTIFHEEMGSVIQCDKQKCVEE